MILKRYFLAGVIVLVFFSFPTACLNPLTAVEVTYDYADFNVPNSVGTLALGINNHRWIVGSFSDITGMHGFVYDGDTFETIDAPGAVITQVSAINDQGDMVGTYWDGTFVAHGFTLIDGEFSDASFPGAIHSSPAGINDLGHFVGSYSNDGFIGDIHGYVLRDGNFETIDIEGADRTTVTDINDAGLIIGTKAMDEAKTIDGFITDGGVPEIIRHPESTRPYFTQFQGINDENVVAGKYLHDSNVLRGFTWDGETFSNFDLPGSQCVIDPVYLHSCAEWNQSQRCCRRILQR